MTTKFEVRLDERPGVDTVSLTGRRIALFSGNYNYVRDGANQALNRLVVHLEMLGAAVQVYSPTSAKPAFEPAGKLVSVPSIAIPGRREYRLALGLPDRIRKDIKRFDPDLVHLSAPDILGTKALSWSRSALGVPVIASLHTRFESYLAYYGLGALRHVAERHLDQFYGRCDYVLVPNRPILEEMSPDGGDPRIRLWGRGVDHELFNPLRRSDAWRCRLGYRDSDVVPLFFGRLVLEKGVDRFADIIDALRRLGHVVRPLIVGDGPAREKMARRLPDAHFTGQLVETDLATAIASADLLINPSQTEAFGNVVLEAMASGLAVVAADSTSTRNLIAHGHDGWLCDTEDSDGCARDIDAIITSANLRQAMGQAAVRTAGKYLWDAILDDVVSVYAEALGTPKPGDRSKSGKQHDLLAMVTP